MSERVPAGAFVWTRLLRLAGHRWVGIIVLYPILTTVWVDSLVRYGYEPWRVLGLCVVAVSWALMFALEVVSW
jgi:hypothetical protein